MGTGTDLERVEEPRAALSLVDGPDPRGAIAYARRIASAIAEVLVEGSGYVTIQGRKHITIEGWQTVAAMTGHSVEIAWSRPVEGIEPVGGTMAWEARAVVADQHGRQVAAGESMADPHEQGATRTWGKGGNYSVRSMAQTRAMSRAASSRMRYIVTLAGFSGTPAEEMDDATTGGQSAVQSWRERQVEAEQRAAAVGVEDFVGFFSELGVDHPRKLANQVVWRKVDAALTEREQDQVVDGEVIEGQEAIPGTEPKGRKRRDGDA